MRKSGSAVLLLLGYANSVDAMTRVRRGVFDIDWSMDDLFDTDDATEAGDTATAATTTADPFDNSFFQDSDDDDTFGASAIINVEADSILQVESETQAEADVEVETAGQIKIGARAIGGSLGHGWNGMTNDIEDRSTASPATHAAPTTQQPTTRTVHTHAHPHTPHTHAPYVCDNGGTWNHSLQRCDCPTGFGGIWCNHAATCPTCYRGTCQVTHGVAKCVCEAGWFLSDCRKHNCNGNGYSEIVNGQAVCNCHNGWFGDFCQEKVNDITNKCKNGQYYNGHCYCQTNYYGKWCEEYRPQRTCSRNCGNGNCYMGTTSDGDYCVCNQGFSGSNCHTVVCTGRCPGQKCRIFNNKAECYDYTPTSCFQKSCSNNQHCVMVGSTPTCQCNTGYSGFPSCNTPISCSTKPCGVNMHCRMNDATPTCVCNVGYYPSGSGTCLKFTPPSCSTKVCSSNQHCIMSSGMPTCVCNNGWTGDHCNVHICNKQCINGSCQWLNGSQRCICNSGYIGETCAQREPQPCTKACAHGGICKINSNGQQYCDCPAGWTSADCTVSTICDLQCQNGGKCISYSGGKRCECPSGWMGALCQERECNQNCGSHGTCIGSGATSTCQCRDGYTGQYCNIKPCPDNCNSRGDCTMGKCKCFHGWSGAACQNQVCTRDCGANGSCAFTITGGQKCICDAGYSGSPCTPIVCDLNCNNGQCVFGDNYTKTCVCNAGYSGANCQISDITPCNTDGLGTSPCDNGCQCTVKTPGQCEDCDYTCTNTNGNSFLGGKCQYQEPTLTCMTEMIRVTVDQELITKWEKATMSTHWGANLFHGSNYKDQQCQFSRSITNSDYAITISAADWAKCGGSVSVQNGMLTVSNKVSRDVNHDVISFEEPIFDWTCQYQIAVAEGFVGPPPPRNPIQIVENHNFNIKMNFYCDPRTDVNRQQLQTFKGNNVIMTDKVFVNIDLNQLNQFQHLPKMGMRLGDCVAETGIGSAQTERFTIIQNGCPTSLGLTEMVLATDSEVEFKFNNFIDRRGAHRGSTQVKITCQISMCGSSCPAIRSCGIPSRRRRGIPEIESELELLENDLFEESEILSSSETDEFSIKDIELYDTVFYMDIEDIIPMQNSTKIVTEN